MNQLAFEEDPPRAPADTLTLELDGWEGPLDLLLQLARQQKVDLARISILALVEQYLKFVEDARALRLELAADYLVMAAWLAYLKSCLLLPKEAQEEPSAEELALRLQFRLQRLDAMRDAAARLMGRDRLGRDVFVRGKPEGLRTIRKAAWDAGLYDLIAVYGQIQARKVPVMHIVNQRPVMALDTALARLEALIDARVDWTVLQSFLPESADAEFRRSALASSFLAALELARTHRLEIDQKAAFSPLYLRACS